MIKRRAIVLYTYTGLIVLLLMFIINNTYSQKRTFSLSRNQQANPFILPDPFPGVDTNIWPPYPKESQKGIKTNSGSTKKIQTISEADRKKVHEDSELKDVETDKSLKQIKGAETKKIETPEKEDEIVKTKGEEKKKEISQTENTEVKTSENSESKNQWKPLYKNYLSNKEISMGMTLNQRIQNRHNRYEEYMDAFNKLTKDEQKKESSKLQERFLDMEHVEQSTFAKDIEFTEDEKEFGAIQPAGEKILLLTASDGQGNSEIGGVLEAARENRKEYCAFHGYTEYFVNLTKYAKPGLHPVWAKMGAIRDAFDNHPEVEWIWWLDTDAIIMNSAIEIGRHILNKRALRERLTYGRPLRNPDANFHNGVYMEEGEVNFNNIDLVFSQDFFGLNAGSFFIRRSHFTDFILEAWGDPLLVEQNYMRAEQDALIHLFISHERYQHHFGLIPQRLLNSYYDDPGWVWSWQENDFVVHLAGCNTKGHCERNFHVLWNKRIQVPPEYQLKNRVKINEMKIGKEAYGEEYLKKEEKVN